MNLSLIHFLLHLTPILLNVKMNLVPNFHPTSIKTSLFPPLIFETRVSLNKKNKKKKINKVYKKNVTKRWKNAKKNEKKVENSESAKKNLFCNEISLQTLPFLRREGVEICYVKNSNL